MPGHRQWPRKDRGERHRLNVSDKRLCRIDNARQPAALTARLLLWATAHAPGWRVAPRPLKPDALRTKWGQTASLQCAQYLDARRRVAANVLRKPWHCPRLPTPVVQRRELCVELSQLLGPIAIATQKRTPQAIPYQLRHQAAFRWNKWRVPRRSFDFKRARVFICKCFRYTLYRTPCWKPRFAMGWAEKSAIIQR